MVRCFRSNKRIDSNSRSSCVCVCFASPLFLSFPITGYIFYKTSLMCFCMFWFGCFSGFSGQNLVMEWPFQLFNVLFTVRCLTSPRCAGSCVSCGLSGGREMRSAFSFFQVASHPVAFCFLFVFLFIFDAHFCFVCVD